MTSEVFNLQTSLQLIEMNSYCWFEVAYFGEYHNADWQKMTYMSFIFRKKLFAKPLPKLQMLPLFNEAMLIHTNGYEIERHNERDWH